MTVQAPAASAALNGAVQAARRPAAGGRVPHGLFLAGQWRPSPGGSTAQFTDAVLKQCRTVSPAAAA
jgi:hypothetical protein